MVDERMSMTFSVRNNPGRYALLLGSGVSTEAEIPTGWAVVNELVKRVATAEDTSIEEDADPIEWYEETYDEPATYENLIEGLARTQTERRKLLEEFFEPSDKEAERGEKQPTNAHESISWLVDNGYIDVILTTNFDQLIEKALRDQGVNPVVISGPGSARGAEPLQHQDAVVVKVNGDYKETNVKNLSSELESYSDPMQQIIDRVFHEYGLIICGWSGEYDTRLRKSLQECETHRYSTYWTYYSDLGDAAQELVAARDAFTIHHDGATSLFTDLRDRVRALEDAEDGEPLTTPIARERVKRYLPREEHKIDLADLIRQTARQTRGNIFDEDRLPLYGEDLADDFTADDRFREYGELTTTIITELMTCAYWGGETVNTGAKAVSDALSTLAPRQSPDGGSNERLRDLRRYPATLALYGVGHAGIAADNWSLVSFLLTQPIEVSHRRGRQPAEKNPVEALHPRYLTRGWGRGFDREGAEESLRSSLKETLRDPALEFFTSESTYERAFKQFELILDLLWYAEGDGDNVVSLGTTYWGESIDELEAKIEEQGAEWPLIREGVLERDSSEAIELLDTIREDLH
jgi:hypothetical protein